MFSPREQVKIGGGRILTSETVQGATLAFQSVDDVHSGDGLPLGVLGVGDGVTNDVFQEHLQHTTGLLVDESGDTLHSTTASQTADGGLGDALDVVTQDFPVTLCSTFSKSLAPFPPSGHLEYSDVKDNNDVKYKNELIKWPA